MSTMLLLIFAVSYAERTNMSAARLEFENLSEDSPWQGWVLSSFYIGYMCTQMIGGWLASRYGGKSVMTVAVLIFAMFDMLAIPAESLAGSTGGALLLCATRVGKGFGEGMVLPTLHAVAAEWLPLAEQGRLITFYSSGFDAGTIISLLAAPGLKSMSPSLGWRMLFIFWGAISAVVLVAWLCLAASEPSKHKRAKQSGESSYILSVLPPDTTEKRHLPIMTLLKAKPVWAIIVMHITSNYSHYVLLSYIVQYYRDLYEFELEDNPLLIPLPYMFAWIGALIAGYFADALMHRGWAVRTVRVTMNTIGMVISCSLLVAIPIVCTSVTSTTVALCVCLFMTRFNLVGFWANMRDIAPSGAGTLMGLSNTLATIPGIVGQPVTQMIIDHTRSSWTLALSICALVGIVGTVVFAMWCSGDPLPLPKSPESTEPSADVSHAAGSTPIEQLADVTPTAV